jgi:hypothetical protein
LVDEYQEVSEATMRLQKYAMAVAGFRNPRFQISQKMSGQHHSTDKEDNAPL